MRNPFTVLHSDWLEAAEAAAWSGRSAAYAVVILAREYAAAITCALAGHRPRVYVSNHTVDIVCERCGWRA